MRRSASERADREDTMLLRHLYNNQLAQASYLVGCAATGEALVVDPNRGIDQYLALAEREGLRIVAVTETHIHADYVSGASELAARTGARLYLSAEGPAEWHYSYAADAGATLVRDGDHFLVGNVRIDVWHTPGHTPEHLAFLVTDTSGADAPMGIFTGDFVFVGDVGRPDLLERAAGYTDTMESAARDLFRSLQRFRALPEWVQVWPGHGAGSACGKALGAVPQSTVGYELRFNWAFAIADEQAFIEAVLAGQPEPPTYFARMKRINKEGPPPIGALGLPAAWTPEHLHAAWAAGTPIIDTRPAAAFAGRATPRALNIPARSAFTTWAGWLVPYDRPFALVVAADDLPETVAQLRTIGLDNVAGYWTPDALDAWADAGDALPTIARTDAPTLRELREREPVTIIDVRGATEYAAGHIAGSRNIPLGYLAQRLDEVPVFGEVVVHCQSGTRSAIAASLLAAHGRHTVSDLVGGLDAWRTAGLPLEREESAAPPLLTH
jgi:hydroxyacylglutathione hydrolase